MCVKRREETEIWLTYEWFWCFPFPALSISLTGAKKKEAATEGAAGETAQAPSHRTHPHLGSPGCCCRDAFCSGNGMVNTWVSCCGHIGHWPNCSHSHLGSSCCGCRDIVCSCLSMDVTVTFLITIVVHNEVVKIMVIIYNYSTGHGDT